MSRDLLHAFTRYYYFADEPIALVDFTSRDWQRPKLRGELKAAERRIGLQNSSRIHYLSRLVGPFVRRKRSNYQSRSLRAESNPNWGMLLRTYLARSTYVLCFFAGHVSRSRRYLQYSRLSGEVERFLGEDRAVPECSMTEASSPLRRPT